MSQPDERRRRGLSPEDRVVWSTFTQTIAPLRKGASRGDEGAGAHEAAPKISSKPGKPAPAQALHKRQAPAIEPPPLTPLSRREKQRVVRGRSEIGGRLDLHGLTQSEAQAALMRFLRNAGAREVKLVLVITGKSGVLRRQVPQWLGLPEFRAAVIGFEPAHAAHGGDGALYVRVRRAR
jgi:DNA-nicking Smr family endonuclease